MIWSAGWQRARQWAFWVAQEWCGPNYGVESALGSEELADALSVLGSDEVPEHAAVKVEAAKVAALTNALGEAAARVETLKGQLRDAKDDLGLGLKIYKNAARDGVVERLDRGFVGLDGDLAAGRKLQAELVEAKREMESVNVQLKAVRQTLDECVEALKKRVLSRWDEGLGLFGEVAKDPASGQAEPSGISMGR